MFVKIATLGYNFSSSTEIEMKDGSMVEVVLPKVFAPIISRYLAIAYYYSINKFDQI